VSTYKLIEVVKDTSKENQSIYDKSDLNTALADMKNDFGVALKADNTLSAYCIVIEQETGARIDGRYWSASVSIEEGAEPIDISIRQRVYTHNNYAEDNITPYESEKLAIGNFNTKAAASMKKSECNFALTIRIDETGEYADFDKFERK
jgi:hypothetical protein